MTKILGSIFAALASVATGVQSEADAAHYWLHVVAGSLADREIETSTASAMTAWRDLGGENMMNLIFLNEDRKSFATIPIEAKQAVLMLAGDMFQAIDHASMPPITLQELDNVCAWTTEETSAHVQYSSRLLFELKGFFKGVAPLTTRETVEHTPLAHFLHLCRPMIEDMPIELVQASLQHAVYRGVATGDWEKNAAKPLGEISEVDPSVSTIDRTLLELAHNTPNEILYSVERSTLDGLFAAIRDNRGDSYFLFDDETGITSLIYPKCNGTQLVPTLAKYRGLGRALGLSIVLGVPLGMVGFSGAFLTSILGKSDTDSEFEEAVRTGFNDVLSIEILKEAQVSPEELSQLWRGAKSQVLLQEEIIKMIKFSSGASDRSIAKFMHQMGESQAFQKQFLKKAVGISHLPVGRADAVFPQVTVSFNAGTDGSGYRIESGDATHHLVKLV